MAADYYWVGGTGNWSELSHWVTTSGGVVGHIIVPTANDNVYFDSNSFTGAGQTVTITDGGGAINIVCHNVDWTGANFNPTITGNINQTLRIYGSLTLIPSMSYSFAGTVNFEATDLGNTVTSGGKAFQNNVVFQGTGGWTLGDDFSVNSLLTFNNGELLSAGHNIGCNGFSSVTATARHLDITGVLLTVAGDFILNSTNFHLDAAGSLIQNNGNNSRFNITGSNSLIFANINIDNSAGRCSIYQASYISFGAPITIDKLKLSGDYFRFLRLDYGTSVAVSINSLELNGTCTTEIQQTNDYHINHLLANEGTQAIINCDANDYFGDAVFNGSYATINGSSSHFISANINCSASINGTNTFDHLRFSGGNIYTIEAGSNQTINDQIELDGTCSSVISISSSSGGNPGSFSKSSGLVEGKYLSLKDIHASGGASFIANNSVDLGNNDGWTINGATPLNLYWVGGGGNWGDVQHWAFASGGAGGACLPTAYDNIYFDQNSFTSSGQIVTVDINAAVCHNIDWTGSLNNPTITGNINQTLRIYGSLTLIPSMSYSFAGTVNFEATDLGNTVTSGGKAFQNNVVFQGTGGWTLGDDFSVNSLLTFNNGELLSAGHNIGCNGFSSVTATARHLDITGVLLTVAGDFILNSTNFHLDAAGSLIQNNGNNSRFNITGSNSLIFANINIDNSAGRCSIYQASYISFGAPITIDKLKLSGDYFRFLRLDYGTSVAVSINSLELNGTCTTEIQQTNDYHINHLLANEGTQAIINCDANDYFGDAVFNGSYVTINGSSSHFISADINCSASINGTNTFDDITLHSGNIYLFESNLTQNIGNQLNIRGNNCYPIQIRSTVQGQQAILSKPDGVVSGDFLEIRDINAIGGASFNAGSYSTDLGNNNGWNFNNSPGYIYGLGPDKSLCVGDKLMTTNFNGAISYLWQDGSTLPYYIVTKPGLYRVKATYAANCTYTDEIIIDTKPTPVADILIAEPSICSGKSVQLVATVSGGALPYDYLWLPSTGLDNSSILNPIASPITTTDYIFKAIGANGCSSQDVIRVNVSSPIEVTLTNTGPTTCNSLTGTTSATVVGGRPFANATPYIYTWNTNPVKTTAAITGLLAGSYVVTASDSWGCSGQAVAILNDPGAPVVSLSLSTNTICSSNSAIATASGAALYEFFIDGISKGIASSDATLQLSGLTPGVYRVSVNGTQSECIGASTVLLLTVLDGLTAGGSILGGSLICSGSTSGLLSLTGQTGTVVKWQSSVSPFNVWTDIANTATTYISGTLAETTQFRAVVQSASFGMVNSEVSTVNVDPLSVGGSVIGGTTICSGSTSGLLTLSGNTGTVVKWQSSVSPFSVWIDVSSSSTTYTSEVLAETTQFRAVVQSGSCASASSGSTTVIVDPPSVGGSVMGGTSICTGSISGILTLSGQTGTVVKWQSSVSPFNIWTDIANTATTYTSGVLTATTQFRAVVQNGSCTTAIPSSTIVTVDPPSVGGSVTGGTTICSGSTSGTLTLSGHTGTVAKWQSSVSPFSIWTDIANTTTTYTSGALTETTQFRAVVQSGSCPTTNSTITTVTVNSLSIAPTGVIITNNNTNNGIPKTLTVTGGNLESGASWQWFTCSCDGSLVGTGSSIVVDPPAETNTTYYIRATGTCNTTICISGTVFVSSATPAYSGSISGTIFEDCNANGMYDVGDKQITNGWLIVLQGPVNLTTTTNNMGYYSFNNLPAGTYQVSQNIPEDWTVLVPMWTGIQTITISKDQIVANSDFADFHLLRDNSNIEYLQFPNGQKIGDNSVMPADPLAPLESAPISISQIPANSIHVNINSCGFSPETIYAKKNSVIQFALTSTDFFTHVFLFDDHRMVGTVLGVAGQETRMKTWKLCNVAIGDVLRFHCDVPGHEARGEYGFLIVTDPQLVATPTSISGETTVCQGQNAVIYTIPPIAHATSYIWTLPTGSTGASISNSISVNYGAAVSGNIKVKGINSCGDVAIFTLAITVLPASVGGSITGGASICKGSTNGMLTLSGQTGTVLKWQSSVAPFSDWTEIVNTATSYTSGALTEATKFRAVVQSGSCAIANSEVTTVNVEPISVGGSVTGGTSVCTGSTSGLLTLSGNTGSVLKWQSTVAPFNSWTDIPNTATTYTSGVLDETTQFRSVVQSGSCAIANSEVATVDADPISVGGSVTGGTTICSGSISGLLTLYGNTGSVVKWQSSVAPFSDWTEIVNTATSYTSGALTEATKFRAVVQSGSCAIANSEVTTVNVEPISVGGNVTGGTSVCTGSTCGLITLSGNTGSVLKWQSSVSPFNLWTDIANTSTTYTSGTLAESTQFRAVVQSGNCVIVNSAVLEVTVDSPSVGGNVTGGTTICSGSTSGLLSLSGHTGSIVKWQNSVSPFSSWTDIANTADTYTSGALTETTQFRAIVQSGSYASANSGVTTVIVDPLSIGGSVAGGTSIYNASISGLLVLTGQTGIVVKWQSSVTLFSSWTDIENTATSYTSEALAETTQFRAIVQSGSCTSANSGSTTITVDPPSVGGSVMGGTSTCNGSTSGLLTLSGHTGTVLKWQSSVSPFSSWTNIDNQATTYISEALTETAQFRAIVQSGSCASASSGSTTVTVDPPSVGGNSTGGTTVCSGSTSGLLDLTGQTGTIIKWQNSVTPFSSWTDIANTATSYTSEALSETTQFRAIVQSGSCASTNSGSTTVTVNPSSVGGRVTGGTSTCNGSTSGLLSLTGQNGTVVKWQSSVSPFNLWTDIANTSTTYTSGTLAESTQFRAVVQSGNCIIVNSAVLEVTVDSPSVGGNVTGGTTICSGGTTGLLSLSGHTGSIIKWQSSVSPFNFWTDISNTATTNTSGALTETTQFRAIVQSGSCASANSGSTTVTVDPPSVGGSVKGGTSICNGSTFGLLSLTGQTGTIVKWQSSVSPFNVWTDIANTATTYTSGVLAETTQFRAVVQNKSCATAISISSTITVNPLPVPTITGSIPTCMGGSYTYFTEANMSGYSWNISEGGTITEGSATNTITVIWNDAGAQQVNVNYINANGCTAKAASFQNVTVNHSPVPPTIAGLSVVCEGTANVTYTTEVGMTGYTWIVSSAGDITSGATSKEINVTWKTPGAQTVTVNYTNASGCTAKAVTVKNLTVNPLPVPTITGQVNTCMGINYNYTTEAGMSGYTWIVSPGGTITDGSTTNNINITWKTAGVQTISVNYINANGCIATNATKKVITVNQLPVPTITGISTVCAETTDVKYTTESGMSGYMWTISGGGEILDGASTNTINVRWIIPGIHTVTVNYINVNGCTATTATDKTITVNPRPIPTIKGQASVCIGNSGITYTTEAAMAEYTWVVSAGGTIISGIKTNTITIVWNTIGDQKLSVNYLDAEGCSAINATEQNVTVNPLPVPTISTSDTTWIGSSYIYKTEADMTNYKWIVSSGGIISTGTETNSTTVKWINYGWQTLSINYINENGCTSEDATIMKMKVINPPLSKTEGISPNGDGINDILIFKDLKNYPGSKLIIFTRIGEKIYESDNYLNDWDGKFLNNGSKDKVTVLSGTYYYVLNLGGTNRTIKGFIYVGY